jgi:hypothetical protein
MADDAALAYGERVVSWHTVDLGDDLAPQQQATIAAVRVLHLVLNAGERHAEEIH